VVESGSDLPVRLAAFRWLGEQAAIQGEVLPWSVLLAGFQFQGERVPLVSQQGIFKPRLCRLPLSIRTAVGGPYQDAFAADGLLHYRYRGSDPSHRENVGLRQAMTERVPLVYLHGHVEGRYHAIWPVFVVADSPRTLTFTVAADSTAKAGTVSDEGVYEDSEILRAYATREVRQRLHQQAFRERVLVAYGERCALCRLRHRELLDASHIAPDREAAGEPRVSNGLSLCKLHHAAFDGFFLTVDPDYRVRVRGDVLEEEDGPMLRHGLQELHGQRIVVPRREVWRPDRDLLALRLERFAGK
jgi:putative restriction endonuclease